MLQKGEETKLAKNLMDEQKKQIKKKREGFGPGGRCLEDVVLAAPGDRGPVSAVQEIRLFLYVIS